MTLIDLYRKALEKLQVVAAGEAVDPDDNALVAAKYAALYEMLITKKLVAWAANDDVPDFAVVPLTAMLAFLAANEFGIDAQRFALEGALDVPGTVSIAERQLRAQLVRDYVSVPATSEYF